jgi:GH24 family phage-related lysozyme (muramidase)
MNTVTGWGPGGIDGAGHYVSAFPKGKMMIGGELVDYSNGITQPQAETLLKETIGPYEESVRRAIKVKITQSQFDALVDMAYNMGIGKMSNLIATINSGDFKDVPNQMMQYNHYTDAQGVRHESSYLSKRCQGRVIMWTTVNLPSTTHAPTTS